MHLYSQADASSLLPIQQFHALDGKSEVGVEEIVVERLDDVVHLTHVDFMKIDVEGHEAAVLRGAERMLRVTDNVYVEISPLRLGPHSGEYIEVFRMLHDTGFTFMGCFRDYWFSKDREVLRAFFGDLDRSTQNIDQSR